MLSHENDFKNDMLISCRQHIWHWISQKGIAKTQRYILRILIWFQHMGIHSVAMTLAIALSDLSWYINVNWLRLCWISMGYFRLEELHSIRVNERIEEESGKNCPTAPLMSFDLSELLLNRHTTNMFDFSRLIINGSNSMRSTSVGREMIHWIRLGIHYAPTHIRTADKKNYVTRKFCSLLFDIARQMESKSANVLVSSWRE